MASMRLLLSSTLLFTGLVVLFSCKKEFCEACDKGNKAPVANAGMDQLVTLPFDSVLLDGSSSSDADGKISEWLWTKISGPASLAISNASTPKAVIRNLSGGIYLIELKIKDDKDIFAKDTVQIVVNDPASQNQAPIANAGSDQAIVLPTNTVILDGSGSTDPDNDITEYAWTKILGPETFTMSSKNSAQTQAGNLTEGIYHFELTVSDALGFFSKDTVRVSVNPASVVTACDGSIRPQINAQLNFLTHLSIAREGMAVAATGTKILFAGGFTGNYTSGWQYYSRVDILDVETNAWTTAELSEARSSMTTAVLGNKIFFAGGNQSSRVDIYDAATNTWSTAQLSSGGSEMTGAAVGNKVVFAGGIRGSFNYSDVVDIYDAVTNTWSTASLTDQAVGAVATVLGNKIYFSGNASDWWAWDFGTITSTISVYDVSVNSWSTSNLNIPRGYLAGIAVGNKNYWAGGLYRQPQNPFTDRVEIRDEITGLSTNSCLFQPNAFFSAVLKDSKIVFFTSGVNIPGYWTSAPPVMNKFDIYDITSNTWSIGVLPFNIYASSVISVNNTIYVAGGYIDDVLSGLVWKLEF